MTGDPILVSRSGRSVVDSQSLAAVVWFQRWKTLGANALGALLVMALLVMALLVGGGDSSTSLPVPPPRSDVRVTDPAATASDAFQRGDFKRVESVLAPQLASGSLDPPSLFMLAVAYAKQQKLLLALETIDRIPVGAGQAYLAGLGQSADWLIQAERYTEAEARLRKLTQRRDSAVAHRLLARLLNNQGLRYEAIDSMRALARLGAATEAELYGMTTFSNPFIHRGLNASAVVMEPTDLCWARVRVYENELDKALAMTSRVCAVASLSGNGESENGDTNGGGGAAFAFLGRLLVASADNRRVQQWLESCPESVREQPEYWAALGIYLQNNAQHEPAVRCFLEAVSRDDTDMNSYLGLARSLSVLGNQTASADALRRAELLEQVDYIASEMQRSDQQLQAMPVLLQQLGRTDEAKAWLKVASRSQLAEVTVPPLNDATGSANWRRCGLALDDWPLPEQGMLRTLAAQSAGDFPITNEPLILTDVSADVGLNMQYLPGPEGTDVERLFMHQTGGAGVGVVDYDLDGRSDLYFAQSSGSPHATDASEGNQLFRNLVEGSFQVVSDQAGVTDAGYGQGVTVGDLNQDGFPDLLVGNLGANRLYLNNGDGTFTPSKLGPAESPDYWTTSLATGDLTGDGLPEVFEVNYIEDARVWAAKCFLPGEFPCNPQNYRAMSDRVLSVQPNGAIVAEDRLAEVEPGYGFGLVLGQLDQELGNDVFVANDTTRNHFWTLPAESKTNASELDEMVDVAVLRGCAMATFGAAESCMGVAWGDFDRNQRLDFHITNYTEEPSNLYLQNGSGLYADQAAQLGLASDTHPVIGWGTQAIDIANNGWSDLVVLNGHLYSEMGEGIKYRDVPQLFRRGADGFSLQQAGLQQSFWNRPAIGRSLAKLDWNRDGRVDLIAYHIDTPAALLENQTDAGHWLTVKLVGTVSERDAIGAVVTLTCGEQRWTNWLTSGDGYLVKNEAVLHFGIGTSQNIDRLEIQWPSGLQSVYQDLKVDERCLAVEQQVSLFSEP